MWFSLAAPGGISDPLTDLLRIGARRLIEADGPIITPGYIMGLTVAGHEALHPPKAIGIACVEAGTLRPPNAKIGSDGAPDRLTRQWRRAIC